MNINTLIRDLTQVAPRSKSEVREMLMKFREDTLRESKIQVCKEIQILKTREDVEQYCRILINNQ